MPENVTDDSEVGYVLSPVHVSRLIVSVWGMGVSEELDEDSLDALESSLLSSVENVSELDEVELAMSLLERDSVEVKEEGIVQLESTTKVMKLIR